MLFRVLKQNPDKLRAACEKLLDKAVEGDTQAFKEITDRIDGKPIQLVGGTGDNGAITMSLMVSYAKPDSNVT